MFNRVDILNLFPLIYRTPLCVMGAPLLANEGVLALCGGQRWVDNRLHWMPAGMGPAMRGYGFSLLWTSLEQDTRVLTVIYNGGAAPLWADLLALVETLRSTLCSW